MKEFDVNTPLDGKWLIEASAGTGKTYTIEQLFLRLIVDNKVSVDSILIVTFTRAATKDLKARLYHRLKIALKEDPTNQYIEDALALFHDAHIYTIHGFCLKMLTKHICSSGITLSRLHESRSEDYRKQECLLQKFLEEELPRNEVAPAQIHHLLKAYSQDEKHLISEILRTVSLPYGIEARPSFEDAYEQFLKEIVLFFGNAESLIKGFFQISLYYKGLCLREGDVKPVLQRQFHHFIACLEAHCFSIQDFETLLAQRCEFLSYFHIDNRKKKPSPKEEDLPYMELFESLYTAVYSIIDKATNPLAIFLKVARLFKPVWEVFVEEQEILHPDRILQLMCQNLTKPDFVTDIQSHYSAVLIDEFQDTDELQWKIFSTLFMSAPETRMFLVGDPKQAIYAFRNADIYTYISAPDHIPIDHYVRLGVCYRADPPLMEALNHLFMVPGFFSLPRYGAALEYWPVTSPLEQKTYPFSDNRGAVHFFHASAKKGRGSQWPSSDVEEHYFLPFIAQEIVNLGLSFKDVAILVRDRYQARRIQEYLQRWNIPAVSLRSPNLRQSPVVVAFRDLLWAILFPQDSNRVAIALAGLLIGWSKAQLSNKAKKQEQYDAFVELRNVWLEHGFIMMTKVFLERHWGNECSSAEERLQALPEYGEFLLLIDFLAEWTLEHKPVPEELIHFLEEWRQDSNHYDDDTKAVLSEEDAVSLLTMHMSKGLEFPVVFALGVMHRDRQHPELFCKVEKGKKELALVDDGDAFLEYLKEIDAEKMRQLYVSLTRAKHRVYVPVLFEIEGQEGTSPMELFLSKYGETLESLAKHPYITVEACQESFGCIPVERIQTQTLHHRVLDVPIYPPTSLVSFSTLIQHPSSIIPVEGTPELPSSSETGSILHNLLEDVPMNCFEEGYMSLLAFVQSQLHGNPYIRQFTTILWQTFTTPLQMGDHCFCLKDVQFWKKESEFLYISDTGEYVSGIVDAVIQYEERIYLIDWKSNYLGPHSSNYSIEHLEEAMRTNSYNLQASLYEEAVTRSIGNCLFAGTAYLFLRGICKEGGVQYGVWFKRSAYSFCSISESCLPI